MRMIRFIGDCHGKWGQYKTLIKSASESIQLGDMGVGFIDPRTEQMVSNPPHDSMVKNNARFIRGNHDNPSVCRNHSRFIPDGHYEDGMFFLGGGVSVDKAYRLERYSWWEDEELTYRELHAILDKYLELKPSIVCSHECPEGIAELMMNGMKLNFPSRTRQVMQAMWDGHRPKVWLFGHWHTSFDRNIMGTRFVCLNELEYLDLDIHGV